MKHFLKKITLGVLVFSILTVGGFEVYKSTNKTEAATFYAAQTPATQLYTGISSSATSARLRSLKDIYGSNLTMLSFGSIGYVTFEPGVSGKEEVASFTGITDNGDGTQTLTGLTRGLLSRFPFGTGGTARSHGSNTTVTFSNPGEFYNHFTIKENAEAVTGYWTVPNPISAQGIASKSYVDGTAFGGVGLSSETATGTVEIATGVEIASSTTNGSIGRLAIPASLATSTYNSATAGLKVVVTQNSGKIDNNFIDSTALASLSGTNTWTGVNTHTNNVVLTGSATSTIAIASTSLYTTSFTWTKPNGLKYLEVEAVGGGGGSGGNTTGEAITGAGGGGAYEKHIISAASLGSTETVTVGAGGTAGASGNPGATSGGTGGTTSFGSHITAVGGSGGTVVTGTVGGCAAGGVAAGSNINISGQVCNFGSNLTADIPTPGGESMLSPFGKGANGVYSSVGTVAGAAGEQGVIIIREVFF